MTTHTKTNTLSPDMDALLAATPLTADSQAALTAATPDFDKDPEFVAGHLRAQLVEDVYRAMAETGLNKNTLAYKLHKTRQYVGRILNESANFTFRTVAELACALGWQVNVRLFAPDERLSVIKTVTRTMKALNPPTSFRISNPIGQPVTCTDYRTDHHSLKNAEAADELTKIAA
ncbi:MAG: hypothetical protein A2269_07155 [Lentisphaerae bacterium RIFOXYA12_FULL_60_10]|nr:MAG: hypothetical protein A2269_07155 [Lentisphaerae bacterium RIFOXYA12_FULL_60_10]